MRTRILFLAALALAVALPVQALAADFVVRVTSPSAYTINGYSNPTLRLKRGSTYTFDIDAPGHPFFIKSERITGTDSGFDTGVTNNGIQTGTLTFTVPLDRRDAPAKLFYQCSVHAPMNGKIMIDAPAPPSPPQSRGQSTKGTVNFGDTWEARVLPSKSAGAGTDSVSARIAVRPLDEGPDAIVRSWLALSKR